MRDIAYSKDALKALKELPADRREQIRGKIRLLAENPTALANEVKALKGSPYLRLRVGDWRIVYEESRTSLMVINIRHRSKAYD